MRIIISGQSKKIFVEFHHNKITDKFTIAEADEFLECVDKLIARRRIKPEALKNARLEFSGTGLLTERIIRVIILGLSF